MSSVVVSRGSAVDRADVDLVSWCGLPDLTDQQHDALWGELNPQCLLELCDHAEILITGDSDELPGYSDEYYKV